MTKIILLISVMFTPWQSLTQLNVNEWHTVAFHFSEHADVNLARFSVQVQLVGDLYALKNDFNSYHDQYDTDVKVALSNWFFYTNSVGDLVDVGGNNYFNIREPKLMLDTENKTFFGWPEGEDGHDRYLWNRADSDGEHWCGENKGQVCDYKPYYCGFGSDPWENPTVLGTSTDAGSSYAYPSNVNLTQKTRRARVCDYTLALTLVFDLD